jgi:hypothetical protein
MTNTRQNLYKKVDIFKCIHDAHKNFQSILSPFHILVTKKCYPHGCVYFRWKCKLLAKKKKCFRNFSHVGKNCTNCKYFFEEKIHQYPEFILDIEERTKFLEDFNEFEEWVNELKAKRIACEGVVSEVKPEFSLYSHNGYRNLSLNGFLVCFKEGYMDNTFFEDTFYLSISYKTQNKLNIRKNDSLEFQANLIIDKGRFKFIRSGRFHFYERSNQIAIQKNTIIVALQSYTIQKNQPSKCLTCEYGQLCDVKSNDSGPQREVICIQGIQDYNFCAISVPVTKLDYNDHCANPLWKCRHLL